MNLEQKRFKAKLDGTLEKRIFKAQLEGRDILVDGELKIIVPLKRCADADALSDVLEDDSKAQVIRARGRRGSFAYKIDTNIMLEVITRSSFYLMNEWSIHSNYRNNIMRAGWLETTEKNTIKKVYNNFNLTGRYENGAASLRVTYNDKTDRIFNFPDYRRYVNESEDDDIEDIGEDENRVIAETYHARKIEFLYHNSVVYNMTEITGHAIDKLATRGHNVRFPMFHLDKY